MTTERLDIDAIADGAELARYRVSTGERMLTGWRRRGGLEVTDRPSGGRARGYVVDRGFHCREQLAAFIGDYVDQARRLDACPMGTEAIATLLGDTETEVADELLAAISTR